MLKLIISNKDRAQHGPMQINILYIYTLHNNIVLSTLAHCTAYYIINHVFINNLQQIYRYYTHFILFKVILLNH